MTPIRVARASASTPALAGAVLIGEIYTPSNHTFRANLALFNASCAPAAYGMSLRFFNMRRLWRSPGVILTPGIPWSDPKC